MTIEDLHLKGDVTDQRNLNTCALFECLKEHIKFVPLIHLCSSGNKGIGIQMELTRKL